MRRMKKIIFIMLISFCLIGCHTSQNETVVLEEINPQIADDTDVDEGSVFVYVCGAVNSEGVYELPAGSRVYEAIEMAGGFRTDAASTKINQAEVLEDAMHLYVPTISEAADMQSDSDGKININEASKEELMTLPGVGSSRAESIIQYRKDVGAFQSIEDIMQISGIKEGLFEKIKDLIKVN